MPATTYNFPAILNYFFDECLPRRRKGVDQACPTPLDKAETQNSTDTEWLPPHCPPTDMYEPARPWSRPDLQDSNGKIKLSIFGQRGVGKTHYIHPAIGQEIPQAPQLGMGHTYTILDTLNGTIVVDGTAHELKIYDVGEKRMATVFKPQTCIYEAHLIILVYTPKDTESYDWVDLLAWELGLQGPRVALLENSYLGDHRPDLVGHDAGPRLAKRMGWQFFRRSEMEDEAEPIRRLIRVLLTSDSR
ncbi:uncharacterized protein JN550_013783 [Neoarthrinium moseri]|uniref:uncharacterized protein n=1 Tax=Neoarthrinium moseri TaxID=1658444 RepID=UPI001FDB6556|nr:uncharacterized protein JN550_013783 [Neoarthrinium moseri]KAI1856500.1 hypothetical protein JN550_013783 [Neoarthrinium moseri]